MNKLWLSDRLAALDLSGEVVIGNLQSGAVTRPSTLTGAPGTFNAAYLSGATAFLGYFSGVRSAWWTLRAGVLAPFLGAEGIDIETLVTDGQALIWKQGRDPVPAPSGSPLPFVYEHYDLMLAPYAEEPGTLTPRVLLADIPATLGYLRIANGFLTGTYLSRTETPRQGAALAIRLSDGLAQKSELAGSMSWGFGVFSTATEIWGAVTSDPLVRFQTYARAPYTSMSRFAR